MTVGEDSASFQLNHLPFDDTDFHGMKLVLEDWASKGFVGDLNVEAATRGYITITTRNWVANHDDPYVSFELHKLKGKNACYGRGQIGWHESLPARTRKALSPRCMAVYRLLP